MAASYIQSKLPSVTYSYNQWTPRTQSKGAACYIQSRRPPHLQSRWPPVTYNNNGRLIYNLDGRLSCAIKLAASYIHNQDGHLTYNHDGHLTYNHDGHLSHTIKMAPCRIDQNGRLLQTMNAPLSLYL